MPPQPAGANELDPQTPTELYRRRAGRYDRTMRFARRWQHRAVDRLELHHGEVVIDAACGTGLNFAKLIEAVGPKGRVVGLDVSPEMLALARQRVAANGWTNVELVEARIEEARLSAGADAALFSFTHDVLQSPAALDNVIGALASGARVAAAGTKLTPHNRVANFVVRRIAPGFITNTRGLHRPLAELDRRLGWLEHESHLLGTIYVAWGRV